MLVAAEKQENASHLLCGLIVQGFHFDLFIFLTDQRQLFFSGWMNLILRLLNSVLWFSQCLILAFLVLFERQVCLQCVLDVKKMKCACEDPVSKLFLLLLPPRSIRKINPLRAAQAHKILLPQESVAAPRD